MKWLVVFSLVYACVLNTVYAQPSIGIKTDFFTASPAMEMDKLDSSWRNPSAGNYAQGKASFEIHYAINKHFEFGLEKRWHYLLGFSEDTAQFYSRLENNQVASGVYDLDFFINAAEAKGIFINNFIPLSSNTSVLVKTHVLQGIRVQDGRLNGFGQVSGSGFSYDWKLDYAYDENRLLDGKQKSVSGWGHSFDVALFTRINNHQSVSINLEDLLYRLYWDSLEQDKGCLDRPLTSSCSVKTSKKAFTQAFPVFATLRWQYTALPYAVSIEAQNWGRFSGLLLGTAYKGMQLQIDVLNEKLNLGYESPRLKVKWGVDQINPTQAKHWQMTLDASWPIL